jgi:putative thioredoxin
MIPPMQAPAAILDVTTATFEKEVLARSRKTPVLVDFWATWCGPCRTLSPVLEKLAGEALGAWTLAKIDIDRSPDLANAFGIQSVPTVVVVKDGEVVDGFLGVQPEPRIRELIAKHVRPARDAVAEALELERAGKPGEAIAVLRDQTKADRSDGKARAQLARLLALSGALGEAELLLDALPEAERESEPAIAARAILAAQDHAGDLGKLEQAVREKPDDLDARIALGPRARRRAPDRGRRARVVRGGAPRRRVPGRGAAQGAARGLRGARRGPSARHGVPAQAVGAPVRLSGGRAART